MFRPSTCQKAASAVKQGSRGLATVSPVSPAAHSHKVVVVGGGSAGMCVSHQLLHSGKFKADDIAIIDPAEWHHYQPGWTLVGGGLKKKEELRKPLKSLIDPKLKFYSDQVGSFSPEENYLTLGNGSKVGYQELIVVPGINVDVASIKGLPEALADTNAPVSTIYRYEYCDKAASAVQAFKKGQALFTQPAGIVKCAGAPQKIMWLSWDHWSQAGLYKPNDSTSPIRIAFATGLPAMFGVPKYSKVLDNLRIERGVEGLFQHDLVSISGNTATFVRPDGQEPVTRKFDFLHAVPKMGPHAFVKSSALADAAGYVDVDPATFRHKKFANVWSIGDAASLPTSKTAAAITAQSPILTNNILRTLEGQPISDGEYDGYTSCPLTTGSKQVLLAEFKYGGIPKETFNGMFGVDQGVPRRAFYHLKKDFFPWVYGKYMVKGKWGGPKGWIK